VQSQGYRALLAWLKDFLINFGTIFSGLIGTVISGVAPVLYPRFNQRLGYATTAIVSLMIGSFLSYRKQLARLDTLEGELAKAKAQRKCEIKLLESRHDRRASTDPKRELLSIDARIHIRNGESPTSIVLKAIDLDAIPEAEFAVNPYWVSGQRQSANALDFASGQQWVDVLHCTFMLPTGRIGSKLQIHYIFEETYNGTIVVTDSLLFPAMA
jgi:hypothetical protein